MLLFKKRFHEGLISGEVCLTFRRWTRPQVKVGGRYRCHPIGVLEVDAIEVVTVADITEQDAKQTGFTSLDTLLEYLRSGPKGDFDDTTELFKIRLHYGGDGDRVSVALDTQLSAEDVNTLNEKLARMDKNGPWTMETLGLIEAHPRTAASKLAEKVGRETAPFKVDVRKLKRLGLTQSFEVGYEISPRGRAYLDEIAPKTPPRKQRRKTKRQVK